MLKFTVVPLTGFLLLTGCASAPPPAPAVDLGAEQSKIRDIESAWSKEVGARDVEKTVSHYADDAVMVMPGAPPAKGKDAIHAGWKGLLDDPTAKLAFSPDRVEMSAGGDLATTMGSYTLSTTNPKTKKTVDEHGDYVTVYKKQADGSWKVIEDMAAAEMAAK